MNAHTVSSDRTMLGERFITCTCGHVAQGGAYDKLAERNFAYHVVVAAHERLDAAEEAIIRARVLDAALMAEYADASHAYFAALQAHDFGSAGRIHREHYSTCRPQIRERVQAELVAAGVIRVCTDGAWEYLTDERVCLRCGKDLSDKSGVYVFVEGQSAPDRTVRGGSGPQVLLCTEHGSGDANNLSREEFERLYRARFGRDPQPLRRTP